MLRMAAPVAPVTESTAVGMKINRVREKLLARQPDL